MILIGHFMSKNFAIEWAKIESSIGSWASENSILTSHVEFIFESVAFICRGIARISEQIWEKI